MPPQVPNLERDVRKLKIECADEEGSYRDNLKWAIDAAGAYQRTGKPPKRCPNNTAFYLFLQACVDVKDFIAKYTQIEGKAVDTTSDIKRFTKMSSETIREMLATFAEAGVESPKDPSQFAIPKKIGNDSAKKSKVRKPRLPSDPAKIKIPPGIEKMSEVVRTVQDQV